MTKEKTFNKKEQEAVNTLACLSFFKNSCCSIKFPPINLIESLLRCSQCNKPGNVYLFYDLLNCSINGDFSKYYKNIKRRSAYRFGKTRKCEMCPFISTSLFDLKDHMKNKHNILMPLLVECPYRECDKKYRNVNGLKYHLNKHH